MEHRIPDPVPPMPLERYLRRAWPMLPGHRLRDLLKKRDVKREGARLGAKDTVRGGDCLTIFLPEALLCPGPEWLARDEGLGALLKPQGLPVEADREGVGADTLLTRLWREAPGAQLLHRLDAAAGGLVLAALNEETLAQGLDTFRLHALRKGYRALAKGGFDRGEGALKAWLVKDARHSRVRVLHGPAAGARDIETRYRVLWDDGKTAGLELEPVTGRTHQLRAHMADFGHPLLGDDHYGDRAFNAARPGPLRLWCSWMTIGRDAPLARWRGQTFRAPDPAWWQEE